MSSITISLLSFSQKHHLERLLPTLMPAAERCGATILMVDNRSRDGSSDFVRTQYPRVQVVSNPLRTGYGGNHNINMRRADSDYFVIMNSDMTVQVDTFEKLAQFMDANPDIGICAPKIVNEDGTIQGLNKRIPTVFDLFARKFLPPWIQRFFQRRLDAYEMRDIGYDHQYDSPLLSGAFMFCRTDLLKRLGGFDESYFLYFEDYDLCRRVQKTHRTVYVPVTEVVHFWERSAHKSHKYALWFMEGAARFFWRWGVKLA